MNNSKKPTVPADKKQKEETKKSNPPLGERCSEEDEKKPLRKRITLPVIISGITGAIISPLVIGISTGWSTDLFSNSSTPPSSSSSSPSPYVKITGVTWIPKAKGRYEVTGQVKNLAAGQVLWTFNQPIYQNTPLSIYVDPGPCAANNMGIFDCSLGFATGSESDYDIIVAVVTTQQAYTYALEKAKLISGESYTSEIDLPHVNGPNTISFWRSTRTNY
jgi:hypothetical protein